MNQPVVVPASQYVALQAESEGLPDVWIVNQALDRFEPKSAFPWSLSIIVEYEDATENGLPTKAEEGVLAQVAAALDTNLLAGGNAVVLARITWNNSRQYVYRVHDPEVANDYLVAATSEKSPLRPFEYQMEHDPKWAFAEDYLEHARGRIPDV